MAGESLIVDLSNYRDRVGSRVPEGDYLVQVEDVEVAKSSAGNTMLNVFYRVIGGDQAGATLLDRLTLTEKALFRVVSFMQAIRMPTPKKKVRIVPKSFVGKVLVVTVEDGEPYMGRVRSEIRQHSRAQSEDTAADDIPDMDGSGTEDGLTDLPDEEDVSDDPTDYDEDHEPEKVKAATKKQAAKRRTKKKAEPEPEPEPEGDDDGEYQEDGDGYDEDDDDGVDVEEIDL